MDEVSQRFKFWLFERIPKKIGRITANVIFSVFHCEVSDRELFILLLYFIIFQWEYECEQQENADTIIKMSEIFHQI